MDIGHVQHDTNINLASLAELTLQALKPPPSTWADVIVAAGSFPTDLSKFRAGSVHRLHRYEWDLWRLLRDKFQIKYGDYGTKHHEYADTPYAASVSLKYTTEDEFVIHRGERTDNHADGHGQYITHAQKLIRSNDYSGQGFSWGDSRLDFYSRQILNDENRKTGNTTTWVQISQNHHITLLHSLL